MITIRKATFKDAPAIANCLLLAMEEIVYKFIGEKDPQKANAFMLHFVEQENNQYSYQNCWVAEQDNEVVGAMNIYDGAKLHELRQPVLEYLKRMFGNHIQPEDETSAGEYYIDSFGVATHHQGKGIGVKMLEFVIDEYVTRRHEVLGLLVDKENEQARRLYIKLGFTSAGTTTLLGKQMEHLQISG